jgi:hypothetical protein
MAIMHFVAGTGTMPKAEAKAVLNDLWAAEDHLTPTGQPVGIYFVVEAQVDPGEGHQSIVEWMHEQGLTYYVISPPGQQPHVLYNGATQVMDGAAITPFIYAQSAVAQGMPVQLLALFVDASNENPLDAQLVQTVESFTDAGYPAKAMNAQMWDLNMTAPEEAVVDPAQTAVAQLPQAAPVAPVQQAPVAPAMPAPVDQTAAPAGPVGQVQAPAFIQSPPEQLAAPVAPAPLDPAAQAQADAYQQQLAAIEAQQAQLPAAPNPPSVEAPANPSPAPAPAPAGGVRWPTDGELDEMTIADKRSLGKDLFAQGLIPAPVAEDGRSPSWKAGDPIVHAIKLGRAAALGTPTPEPQAPAVAVVEPTQAPTIPGAMSAEEHAARVAAIPPMDPALQQLPAQTPYGMGPGGPTMTEAVGTVVADMTGGAMPGTVVAPEAAEQPVTLGQLTPEQFSQQAQDILEARATERGIERFRSLFPASYGPEAANDVSLLHEHGKEFAEAIYRLTGRRSPELTVAINKLQETIFWAEAALTRYDDEAPDITFITQSPAFPNEPQV